MKTLKYIIGLGLSLMVVILFNCTDDENFDYLDNIVAPTNVTAAFRVTPDNTGLVTIIPNSEGAVSYNITLGDASTEKVTVKQGESTNHIYQEGTYTVTIEAVGITGLKTQSTQNLEVSFKAPENIEVSIENDQAITKQVNVVANADFAISYEVYFGETGNDEPVSGNIGETVSYTYQEPGTYSIRIVIMGAAIETTEYTQEFEVTEILQPVTAAPAPPNRDVSDVVSIYSDAYANVTLSELNPDWGQSTTLTEIQIEGNNTWVYNNLNYTGIVTDYGNPTNLSGMTHVHFDYWTPNGTTLGLKLVNTSYSDGDPLKEDIENVGEMIQGEWVSVDIALADYTTDVSGITQLLFDSLGNPATVFIDNLYFYKPSTVAETPEVNAPAPTQNASNVISIFSNSYTNIGLSELNPNWGQTTTLTTVDINGNNIWLYEALNFTGIVTDYGNPTNLSGMNYVHFDYFTPDAESLGLKIVNTVIGQEDIEFVNEVVRGTWVSVTIPMSQFSIDASGVTQLLFDTAGGSAKVYIDNLYFYSESTTQPAVAAPVSTIDASKVISIYSDVYTGVGLSEVNPNWGQTTTLSDFSVNGDNIWLYQSLNYSGIVTSYDNPTNLSGMQYLHFDYYTTDATTLGFKIVNTVVGEEDIEFIPSIITGTWVSVTIPLSKYNIDLSNVTQLLWDTSGGSATVYVDNIYFHN